MMPDQETSFFLADYIYDAKEPDPEVERKDIPIVGIPTPKEDIPEPAAQDKPPEEEPQEDEGPDIVGELLAKEKGKPKEKKEKKERRKGPRKATKREYIINLVVFFILLWELGIIDQAMEMALGEGAKKGEVRILQNFNVIEPDWDVELNRAIGESTVTFVNMAEDHATINEMSVINTYNNERCKFNLDIPRRVKAGERLSIKIMECGIANTPITSLLGFGVIIKGRTTLKSRLISDVKSDIPVPGAEMSPDDLEKRKDRAREMVKTLEDPNKEVDFISSGTIIVR